MSVRFGLGFLQRRLSLASTTSFDSDDDAAGLPERRSSLARSSLVGFFRATAASVERTTSRRLSRISRPMSASFADALDRCAEDLMTMLAEVGLTPEAAANWQLLPVFMRRDASFGMVDHGRAPSKQEVKQWHARCEEWLKRYKDMTAVGADADAETVSLLSVDGSKLLSSLARDCPKLKEVALNDGWLDDNGLSNFAMAMKGRLIKLDLHGTHGFTDRGLKAIAAHCDNLTALRLGGCDGVTDASLASIAKYCPHLTLLELSASAEARGLVTAKSLTHLSDACVVERFADPASLSRASSVEPAPLPAPGGGSPGGDAGLSASSSSSSTEAAAPGQVESSNAAASDAPAPAADQLAPMPTYAQDASSSNKTTTNVAVSTTGAPSPAGTPNALIRKADSIKFKVEPDGVNKPETTRERQESRKLKRQPTGTIAPAKNKAGGPSMSQALFTLVCCGAGSLRAPKSQIEL